MKRTTLVGIDVGARELVLALESGNGQRRESTFANDADGHRKLVKRLRSGSGPVRVCLAATGIYHLDLCLALHAAKGIEVMVVNPRATKDFARSQLKRSKTDPGPSRSTRR